MQAAFPADDLDLVLSLTPEFWSRFGGARLFMTGGTGFIGSWLLQSLQRANDTLGSRLELIVLSRDPERAQKESPHMFNRRDTRLVAGNMLNFTVPAGKLDLMVHAAADVGDPHRAADPLAVFDSIMQGTRRALDLADASGASRFLLTSSGAIYGIQPASIQRMPETHACAPDLLQPAAAYGNGKRAAEWLACTYAAQFGLGACIARIYALIGPGLPLNGPFAAGNFIRDALAGRPIEVRGDGRPLRSFLYMADLCVWLLRILGTGKPGQAYNVGSESAVSIAELAQHIVRASGAMLDVNIEALPTAEPAPRYLPDTRKAREELGLAEFTGLDAALLKTFNWSRSSITS